MYVQKVRLTRSKVAVEYKTPTGESHSLECSDAPLPSFVAAIHALAALILDVLHLPSDYGEHLTPTGLTLTDKQEAKLVTITGKKDLPDAHAPFNIATPLRFLAHPETEGSYSPPLTDDQVALVEEVLEEAKKYVKGERAQGQLPLDSTDDEEGSEPETPEAPLLKFSGATNENGTEQPVPDKPKAKRTPPKRGRKAAAGK